MCGISSCYQLSRWCHYQTMKEAVIKPVLVLFALLPFHKMGLCSEVHMCTKSHCVKWRQEWFQEQDYHQTIQDLPSFIHPKCKPHTQHTSSGLCTHLLVFTPDCLKYFDMEVRLGRWNGSGIGKMEWKWDWRGGIGVELER